MSKEGIAELTWEKGQLAVHGFGAGARNKWDTLESVVQQGTIWNKVNLGDGGSSGLVKKRRTRCHESGQDWGDVSVCASANAAPSQDDSASLRPTTTDPSQSHSARKGRAAAVHNQSERRRRDRINQKMKALQKLVPNASKTDKASILDEVIHYLKQLQTQVQLMSARSMLPLQHQLQMSIFAPPRMPLPLRMLNINTLPSSAHQLHLPDPAKTTFLPLHHPYNPFLPQSINMDMYNTMAALYGHHMNQTTKPTSNMQFNSTHEP